MSLLKVEILSLTHQTKFGVSSTYLAFYLKIWDLFNYLMCVDHTHGQLLPWSGQSSKFHQEGHIY